MDKCVICGCRAIDGNAIFRINEYGVGGIGACQDHIYLFPNKKPDEEVLEIVKIFAEKDLRVLIGKKIDLEIAKAKAELEKIEYDLEGTQDD